ncbi:hypothetical protein [Streptomyces sp. NEAU-174]|uniref:hypothetical protein n=1 Tax=Streptomyces sp. NEAU-174 TaxID=3458254 RepID=UPI004043D992
MAPITAPTTVPVYGNGACGSKRVARKQITATAAITSWASRMKRGEISSLRTRVGRPRRAPPRGLRSITTYTKESTAIAVEIQERTSSPTKSDAAIWAKIATPNTTLTQRDSCAEARAWSRRCSMSRSARAASAGGVNR